MLFSILRNGSLNFQEKLLQMVIVAFCVLLSLSVHEFSHGAAAYFAGDKTAKYSGRLSINPFAHLDPFGAACLFLFGFGWAKPVPVNPWNFKHQKSGMVITSLAGPFSNFLLAFIAEIGAMILGNMQFASASGIGYNLAVVFYVICDFLVITNLGLGIFNLIPIPPLDGSKVLTAILPRDIYFKIMNYERYGFIILFLLINTPVFSSFLNMARNGVLNFYIDIIGRFIH